MTYRIEGLEDGRTVAFQGLLDRHALAELARRCEAELGRAGRLRVWLRAGTRVEAGVLDELVRLEGVTLAAEAPFLARWIEICVERSGRRSGAPGPGRRTT